MRQLTLLVLLVWTSTVPLGAEPRFPPQRPQTPQPAPVMPNVRDDTSPRLVTIEGLIVVPAAHHPAELMEVRLEGVASERIGFAYADDSGRFAFRDVALRNDTTYYVVAEIEGFEPYRERLDRQFDLRFGGHLTIMLETPATTLIPADEGPYVVDVGQLLADIPEEAVEDYERATAESEDGNTERSIEHLMKALERAPDYAEAHNHLGRQYLTLGRIEDARTEFETARDLNPAWVIPVTNLGTLFYQEGERHEINGEAEEALRSFRQAVETMEGAVRLDPRSPRAHSLLGTALYKVADYSRAEFMLTRSLELQPDLDDSRLSLINVYSRQGRLAEALETVTEYLERNPDSPQAASLERVRDQLEGLLADQ